MIELSRVVVSIADALELDYLRTWSAKTHAVPTQQELEQLIAEYAAGI